MIWEALARVPALDEAQWRSAGALERWLVAARASVLPLTLGSALFGVALAWPDLHGVDAVLVALALLLAHATNNLLNDHVDHGTGLDVDNYFRAQYGTHPLAHGWLSARTHRAYILGTGTAALVLAVVVLIRSDWAALVPALAGAFFLLFYTWPLKRWALGEVSVWLVWGPLMVGGVVWTLTGSVDTHILLASSVFGIGPLLVIVAKHTDKIADDTARRVKTLPVLLGETRSRQLIVLLLGVQLVGVWFIGSWWFLLLLLALPSAWRLVAQVRAPRPDQAPTDDLAAAWPLWFTVGAFLYARNAGGLLVLAAFGEALSGA